MEANCDMPKFEVEGEIQLEILSWVEVFLLVFWRCSSRYVRLLWQELFLGKRRLISYRVIDMYSKCGCWG